VAEPKRVYTDDEVRTILGRAIERQRTTSPEGLSHDDLLAVARDAGISADALEAAAAELSTVRETESDELSVRKERASDFRIHVFTYLPIMVFLAFVNVMTTHYPWVVWPALAWGLALALHARFALFPTDVEIANEARERGERRRRAEEKARRKATKSELKEGARELGRAVERGVAVVLSETAKMIHDEIGPDRGAKVPTGKRVRVDDVRAQDEELDEEDEAASERQSRRR
jgi:hypothetical protein